MILRQKIDKAFKIYEKTPKYMGVSQKNGYQEQEELQKFRCTLYIIYLNV